MKSSKTPTSVNRINGKSSGLDEITIDNLIPKARPLPENLEEEFQFDAEWNTPDTLLRDQETDKFYLGYSDNRFRGDPRAVSVVEALEWYIKGLPYSTGSSGDLSNLCRVAAAQLRKADAQTAVRLIRKAERR